MVTRLFSLPEIVFVEDRWQENMLSIVIRKLLKRWYFLRQCDHKSLVEIQEQVGDEN